MTTLAYPSDRFPAPPAVFVDIPDTWEARSVPGVMIAGIQSQENPDFTPNVIVRGGTRPASDTNETIYREIEETLGQRPGGRIGALEAIELNAVQWQQVDVRWTDRSGLAVHQLFLFTTRPQNDMVQDFIQVTGSAGGAQIESDISLVQQVMHSVTLG